jgi:hypothetical protein
MGGGAFFKCNLKRNCVGEEIDGWRCFFQRQLKTELCGGRDNMGGGAFFNANLKRNCIGAMWWKRRMGGGAFFKCNLKRN